MSYLHSDSEPDEEDLYHIEAYERVEQQVERQSESRYGLQRDMSDEEYRIYHNTLRQYHDVVNPISNLEEQYILPDLPYEEEHQLQREMVEANTDHPLIKNFNLISNQYRHFRLRILLPYSIQLDEFGKQVRNYYTDANSIYNLTRRRLFVPGRVRGHNNQIRLPNPKLFLINLVSVECVFKKIDKNDLEDLIYNLTHSDEPLNLSRSDDPLISHFYHYVYYDYANLNRENKYIEISRTEVFNDTDTVFRYSPPWKWVDIDSQMEKGIYFPTCYQKHTIRSSIG